VKPHPDIPDQFALQMAIARDLPVPITWYAVWFSRAKLFELRRAGEVGFEVVNGQACLRPSKFAMLVEQETARHHIKSQRLPTKLARKASSALVFKPELNTGT
jgi:hypothetical protein